MVHLQKMHETFAARGLIVLGFNSADKVSIAKELMAERGVTYRNVLAPTKTARDLYFRDYRGSGVPLNYIIDRQGKVAAAFYGYREDDPRVVEALEELGVL